MNNSDFQPIILMDERERGTIRAYFQALPCQLRIATMEVGDYVVSAEMGIERKRGDDFVASLLDNRLFGQLRNMTDLFSRPVLILEDLKKCFERAGIKESSIYGAMVYVAYKMHIAIVPSGSEEETAKIVWSFAKQQQLNGSFPPENPADLKLNDKKEISIDDQKYFIEGLLDVGDKRADAFLEKFRTPAEILSAIDCSTVEFTKAGKPKGVQGPIKMIPGIGPQFLLSNHALLRNKKNSGDNI